MYFSPASHKMENNTTKIGNSGENLAKNHLRKKGYEILESQWRFGKYEVDIIAKNHNTIVFVEVKTRKNDTFGSPESFVSRQKQKFLIAAAQNYMSKNNLEYEARFDIIAITGLNKNQAVKHLEAAFYPPIK